MLTTGALRAQRAALMASTQRGVVHQMRSQSTGSADLHSLPPMTKSVGLYQYPWHTYNGLYERFMAVFTAAIRRPLAKIQLGRRIGEFDVHDLVTMYKAFKDGVAFGDATVVAQLCGTSMADRVQQLVERRGRLKWECRVEKSKVVNIATIQTSETEQYFHVILKVDSRQRVTPLQETGFDLRDLEVIDPKPVIECPLPRPKKKAAKGTKLFHRSTPYLDRSSLVKAADWRRTNTIRTTHLALGDVPADGAGPVPVPLAELQLMTEYVVYEIKTVVGATSAQWQLLGFVDEEGRFQLPVKEVKVKTAAAETRPAPTIRLFAGSLHGRPRVPLGSTDHKRRGHYWG
uniref:Uncharacterized protein n=1 Tax=Eutreptiella gymnastica TaxID=73025 RepID=A0A7S1IT06_9EUGL|mmetsp:Transcript_40875/g.73198  ORF Transcript_40875/g.73198 Transcript_40875/m.73198 type:complete len:345 (+) Transcript_40875:25-1059(+)